MSELPELRDERSRPTVPSSTKADVRRFYDAYAPNWDTRFRENLSSAHLHRRRARAFLEAARLGPEDRVLELGCGTAPYLGQLPLIRSYHGFDMSPEMIEVARRRSVELGIADRATFTVGDAEQLEGVADGSATVVCFFGLIEHLFDLSELFRTCRRVLAPGGRLIGVGSNGWSPWYSVLSPLVRESAKHLASDRYHTSPELRRHLEAHGFESVAFDYWGFVPPGDLPDWMYPAARLAETIAERTPLRYLAGGLVVTAEKP